MQSIIRYMEEKDRHAVTRMMRDFYSSPAVFTNGSEEIFEADFNACIGESPFIEGYVFEGDGEIMGYAMIAKSFSTEFGKPCIWIEDLYIKDEYRGLGIGKAFMEFIADKYDGCVIRLEAEEENERAIKLYEKCGFNVLPYVEMIKGE